MSTAAELHGVAGTHVHHADHVAVLFAEESDGAALLGKLAAEAAKAANVTEVVFDRSGFKYHGRVKAIAEAARENGLKF